MEMLHAIFHRGLVGACFVYASVEQREASGIHALCDFVVLDRGFHIGFALGFNELSFKESDFFRIIKFNNVDRFLRRFRVKRR